MSTNIFVCKAFFIIKKNSNVMTKQLLIFQILGGYFHRKSKQIAVCLHFMNFYFIINHVMYLEVMQRYFCIFEYK